MLYLLFNYIMIIIVWLFNYLFYYYLVSVCYHYSHLWCHSLAPNWTAISSGCLHDLCLSILFSIGLVRWRSEAFMKPRHALAAYISRATTVGSVDLLECGIVESAWSQHTQRIYYLCTGSHQSLNLSWKYLPFLFCLLILFYWRHRHCLFL